MIGRHDAAVGITGFSISTTTLGFSLVEINQALQLVSVIISITVGLLTIIKLSKKKTR